MSSAGSKRTYARPIPENIWEQKKKLISDLYCSSEIKYKDIVLAMNSKHGFEATIDQYRKQFKKWGWKRRAEYSIGDSNGPEDSEDPTESENPGDEDHDGCDHTTPHPPAAIISDYQSFETSQEVINNYNASSEQHRSDEISWDQLEDLYFSTLGVGAGISSLMTNAVDPPGTSTIDPRRLDTPEHSNIERHSVLYTTDSPWISLAALRHSSMAVTADECRHNSIADRRTSFLASSWTSSGIRTMRSAAERAAKEQAAKARPGDVPVSSELGSSFDASQGSACCLSTMYDIID
ncbi:hypothetical protein EJ05DRAFT_508772 [Pseudovirgaria hyperparasitica]|uniref:Clr5 domain-containing protein n=1 Tax=Pseudovirgaria hyperparasitica TaxID=470096 RepID=A0A6A6WDZ8_9PEZI|nr:uncharacterized protein EJ05DRAFT_508772 [Pseudovirgaria hyperparasitica]KAF2760210.1 hypothetical protein EJ05DRAFT_508772 [Pseudovirgaria hyperparasitica]